MHVDLPGCVHTCSYSFLRVQRMPGSGGGGGGGGKGSRNCSARSWIWWCGGGDSIGGGSKFIWLV